MQFKYPEIFYFLFVLIIPIIVHLFQLQKFKKIAFTNVQFLQKISLETRKSSRLKKLLILATRLLGIIAILFTFSQPYFSENKSDVKNHNFIYLDNSLSLNTNSKNGNELRLAAQKIIQYASETDRYSLLTNDDLYSNISKKDGVSFLTFLQSTPFFNDIALSQTSSFLKDNLLYNSLFIII